MFSITSSFQLLVVWREWRKFRLTACIVRRKGEVIGSRSNLDQGPLKIQDGESQIYRTKTDFTCFHCSETHMFHFNHFVFRNQHRSAHFTNKPLDHGRVHVVYIITNLKSPGVVKNWP